jgi:hypothetical protein
VDPLHRLAEARIQEAIESGALADNPLKGRRLVLEDLSGVPAELRGGYLLLKTAGALPEELEVRKHVLRLADLLAACADPRRADGLREELSASLLRYRILRERRGAGAGALRDYDAALERRLGPATRGRSPQAGSPGPL